MQQEQKTTFPKHDDKTTDDTEMVTRQPWQTPELTHLDIKRTMSGSAGSDDFAGSEP